MIEADVFEGTRIWEIVNGLDAVYAEIDSQQREWKKVSPFSCADGCGQCCVDFEPDVLESEALYLAVWMLHHQRERAFSILEDAFRSPRSDPERGCMFFDPATPYHCTVYGGRNLICRLFGYTGDRGKDGLARWKPCKFLPLEARDGGASLRKQYSAAELLERFGAVPPQMTDISGRVVALSPESPDFRRPLREALPEALRKIVMVLRFLESPPEPNPEAPQPRAS
ncbi:YkgJ family cysteine cluster protein [Treponema zuelzerae]|uniref:YkgJ family cysteine cluster protein n=1 Tax=Teretinema zuelzerae TaxID=156 RepID=A0AAE3JM67_9SPIR|nr:YkgJ family cysteine cluster protein [Teretinema zuelzerae]MCD1655439.1 YkgJ family cysteine cluster protein [Teretinema zuelzerae]